MCPLTVSTILTRAVYPGRVRIVVIQQNVKGIGDTECDMPEEGDCEEHPEDVICRHKEQVDLYRMEAGTATGPVTARAVGSRFYHGERYALQIDAHLEFRKGWDEDIIGQHRRTGNDMAVLTTYLSDVVGTFDREGEVKRKTIPIMCESKFVKERIGDFMHHQSQPELPPPIPGTSILSVYFAAGFSFSSGKFVQDVPYDHNLPMTFQGEEISVGVRGWTWGYDFYTPARSICYHYYTATKGSKRKHVHMFWENR